MNNTIKLQGTTFDYIEAQARKAGVRVVTDGKYRILCGSVRRFTIYNYDLSTTSPEYVDWAVRYVNGQ